MKRGLLLLFAWCVLFFQGSAFAGSCEGCDRSLSPRLWIPDGDPATDRLPLKSSDADIVIDGPIARVTVTQRYGNSGTRPINARYVFPGSTRAAVHGLTMRIGERVVKAKIKEKEEAARIFEAARQEGKRAALLSEQRPNVFTMDVANILPGDEVELTLQYTELLVPDEGVYEVVYPTVVGPRYGGDPMQSAKDAGWFANPYTASDPDGSNPAQPKTSLRVRLESPIPVADLTSVQHRVKVDWQSERQAKISLDPGETQPGNRDFILRFRLRDKQIASGVMTFRQDGENYFLMMAQPPARVAATDVLRREYLFVVDVSGSMHGFPLDTARSLMKDLLAGLKPSETFNVLFFAGGSQELSSEPLFATPANLQRAMTMLESFDGGGGTELLPALQQAFAMPRTPDTSRGVVVITDGYVTVEREVYDLIAANLNDTNVFAFGIGSTVNRHLIEVMAHAGAGESFVVTSDAEAAPAAARFRRYVEAPVLSDISLGGDGVELFDMEPAEIPVMLAERPIVVFGKYRGAEAGATLRLTGRSATGEYAASLPLAQSSGLNHAELLPVLWARQRLMRLADLRGEGVESDRTAIVDLGLRYSLLTPYTSFVAVDEVVANPGGSAKDVKQPLPLPQGVSTLAVASPVPEPEDYLLFAIVAAIGAWTAARARKNHAVV